MNFYLFSCIFCPPLVFHPSSHIPSSCYSSCRRLPRSDSTPHTPLPQCACCRALWLCDGLLRRERAARLAGQPASTHHPSARHAVVPEFCWELSACLCLFLRRLLTLRKDVRTHAHAHTLCTCLSPLSPPSRLISTVRLNSNTRLISILKRSARLFAHGESITESDGD